MKHTSNVIYPIPESRYRSVCPYCGFEQMPHIQPSVYGNVIVCDFEMGGCDKPYMVTIVAVANVDSRTIEGYESEAQEVVTEVT